MKMKNNNENKAMFFAQYWAQKVYNRFGWPGIKVNAGVNGGQFDALGKAWLKLRDLSSLTSDEAADIALILDIEYSAYHEGAHFDLPGFIEFVEALFTEEPGCYIDSYKANVIVEFIDYLRSKGFAIPFHGLTVPDLIEYGWIKLNEE